MPLFAYLVPCPYPSCSHKQKVVGARNAQLAEQKHAAICPMGRWTVEISVEMLTCRRVGCNYRFWSRRGGLGEAMERRELHEKYCQHRK
jgi:hypothetical protein